MPHILVTNDDGVLAPGIQILAEACRSAGQVTVVSPDREQSAQSHALTMTRPLRPVRRPDGSWQVDGTPTDCVLLALEAPLVSEPPQFVFSGINHGPNMGEDVLYSGTVSAAMEAVVLGIPGVAFSFAGRRDDLMAGYGALVADLVRKIVALEQMPPNTLLNINLPGIPVDEVQGIRVVPLGSRFYSNSVMKQQDPWGRDVFWIGGGTITWTGETDTDHAVVRDGYVSVTPLQLDITNHALLDTVRDWALRLEE
ncbi:MAG: 5'/3'-nucleotidase SurE [Gemmatimonadales bacterium]|nr:5'/3'-nucleotidase SurE [Gemmatimonadales bacterium]MDZ4388201.1 5'/3'-nucleotidase SurE [Gemmatimonadales bacterium]